MGSAQAPLAVRGHKRAARESERAGNVEIAAHAACMLVGEAVVGNQDKLASRGSRAFGEAEGEAAPRRHASFHDHQIEGAFGEWQPLAVSAQQRERATAGLHLVAHQGQAGPFGVALEKGHGKAGDGQGDRRPRKGVADKQRATAAASEKRKPCASVLSK